MTVSYLKCKWNAKSDILNSILAIVTLAVVLVLIAITDSKPVSALPLHSANVRAIPAFARKYGLPCSACHTAWPELNNFGQVFRDNGYQLNNEHDSPIYQDPGYFPITMRITPNWHRESTSNQTVDTVPGVAGDPITLIGFSKSKGHNARIRSFRDGHLGYRNTVQEHYILASSFLGRPRFFPLRKRVRPVRQPAEKPVAEF